MTLDDRTEQTTAKDARLPVRPDEPAKERQAGRPKKARKAKKAEKAERKARAHAARSATTTADAPDPPTTRKGPGTQSTAGDSGANSARGHGSSPMSSTSGKTGSGLGPAPVWALDERSARRFAAQARASARTSTATEPAEPTALTDATDTTDEPNSAAQSAVAEPQAGTAAGGGDTEDSGAEATEPHEEDDTHTAVKPAVDPAAVAFDLLHTTYAAAFSRQAFLLTGNREVCRWAVARAFHIAWERWPEVATDPDPAGWVRAVTYEYALSPWLRFWPGHNAPEAYSGPLEHRDFLEAFWALPRTYRRALLLHDGLGLSLAETAAETEASTPATAGRLRHAREALAATLPQATDTDSGNGDGAGNGPGDEASERLVSLISAQLAKAAAAHRARPETPRAVRAISETVNRRLTLGACGMTAVLVSMTSFTIATTESGSLLPTGLPAAVAELAR